MPKQPDWETIDQRGAGLDLLFYCEGVIVFEVVSALPFAFNAYDIVVIYGDEYQIEEVQHLIADGLTEIILTKI